MSRNFQNRSPNSKAGASKGNDSDLYQQLITNNELVKELDDIEAISQQISQHAEVLYQNWKSHSPQNPISGDTTSGASTFPRRTFPHKATTTTVTSPTHMSSLSYNSSNKLNGGLEVSSSSSSPHSTYSTPTRLHHQQPYNDSSNISRGLQPMDNSSSSSNFSALRNNNTPVCINSTSLRPVTASPLKVNEDQVEPLELLASPEVNGNLKDLVNSFVSTDRAKQAARQTISDTISNMTRRSNGSSASSTSSFSSRGVSPLKSPMLAAGSAGLSSGPLSPSASSTISSISSDSQRSSSALTLRAPFNEPAHPYFTSNNDIHTTMRPMFGTAATSNPSKTKELKIDIGKASAHDQDTIPIPVQHLGRSASPHGATSQGGGLQSPKVLQTINTPLARQRSSNSNRNSLEFDMPLPNLHAANVERMRQRFEEAKQRINMMHQRAMEFPGFSTLKNDIDTIDMRPRFIDPEDNSNILLEQLRRRSARRRETPVAPHPELTPQQKQHIIERSVTPSSMTYNSQGFPLRRFLSGGSVAERVMIFERCPTVFGPDTTKESRNIPTAINENKKSKLEQPSLPAPSSSSVPWKNQTAEMNLQPAVNAHASAVRNRLLNNSASLSNSRPVPIISTLSTASTTIATPISATKTSTSIPITKTTASLNREPLIPSIPSKSASVLKASPTGPRLFNQKSNSQLSRPLPKVEKKSLRGIAANEAKLPRFYHPHGNPAQRPNGVEGSVRQLREAVRKLKKSNNLTQEDLGDVLKECGYHMYWRSLIFNMLNNSLIGDQQKSLLYQGNKVSLEQVIAFWRRMCERNHDPASQTVFLLTRGVRKTVIPEDFVLLIQDVVETHPGLGFLKEATEFHSRYVHTVIARIFFCVNRSWSGKISIPELRKSNFLAILKLLEDEEDINQITDFFSYEHFYVIYCKFWELDKDHDLFIDREDLSRHNDHAISTRMIDRIFCGAVTRGSAQKEGKMSYTEFVWFLLAEEDKRHPTAIEYWFRCIDLDGDGYLSMYELEYFYEEQLQRMEQLGIETLPFEDCLCQMLDMIMPKERTRISLQDLKHCPMTPIFFDTFFNLEKYLDHEQRDPFASQREMDEDGNEMSDWDRFAAEEYELLVAEEGNAEELDDLCYDDELENNADMHLEEDMDDTADYSGEREEILKNNSNKSNLITT